MAPRSQLGFPALRLGSSLRRRIWPLGPICALFIALGHTRGGAEAADEPDATARRRPVGPGAGATDTKKKDRERITRQVNREASIRAKLRSLRPRDDRDLEPFPDPTPDATSVPRLRARGVQRYDGSGHSPFLGGWTHDQWQPAHVDHRRRDPPIAHLDDFGHTLALGEHFVYDVSFANNPVGMVDVRVEAVENDFRGPPPRGRPLVRVVGRVNTSGVLSLLSSVRDTMTSWIDAKTGAAVRTHNVMVQEGLGAKYRDRETVSDFEGRGFIRIVDTKDGKTRKVHRVIPADTFDPLSAIAWIRSLALEPGQQASAHAMDMRALLRLEVANRGPSPLDPLPNIATALGLAQSDLDVYEGVLTRVSRYDDPLPDRRRYNFRAWVGRPEPRILLALESDMWLGIVRLTLSGYDPPREVSARRPASQSDRSSQPRTSASANESPKSGRGH